MNYVSTRGETAPRELSQAIAAGLAPDGGLFVPQQVPHIDVQSLGDPAHLAHFSAQLLAPFFESDVLAASLPELCEQAFTFQAPLIELPGQNAFVLELFHGPTAAFKDFGARFLAACMQRLRTFETNKQQQTTVLVATSGDTGSAVGAAFEDIPNTRVLILYPEGRVSPRQAHQLGCFKNNVHALRVKGTFDDCQRLVKQAFNDSVLREQITLASANSISLGRLLPQMTYYAQAAVQFKAQHGKLLNFIVPTGNLGNAFAALLARASGLPIGDVILATNTNSVLHDYLISGKYEARPSIATLANAMDVGNPSNLERLNWLFPNFEDLKKALRVICVSDADIQKQIQKGQAHHGQIWCPHTACAVEALEWQRAQIDERSWAIVATAHPAKFETIVEPLLGHSLTIPPALQNMLLRPSQARLISADYAVLKALLLEVE
jgi:threonine synthase